MGTTERRRRHLSRVDGGQGVREGRREPLRRVRDHAPGGECFSPTPERLGYELGTSRVPVAYQSGISWVPVRVGWHNYYCFYQWRLCSMYAGDVRKHFTTTSYLAQKYTSLIESVFRLAPKGLRLTSVKLLRGHRAYRVVVVGKYGADLGARSTINSSCVTPSTAIVDTKTRLLPKAVCSDGRTHDSRRLLARLTVCLECGALEMTVSISQRAASNIASRDGT